MASQELTAARELVDAINVARTKMSRMALANLLEAQARQAQKASFGDVKNTLGKMGKKELGR